MKDYDPPKVEHIRSGEFRLKEKILGLFEKKEGRED